MEVEVFYHLGRVKEMLLADYNNNFDFPIFTAVLLLFSR